MYKMNLKLNCYSNDVSMVLLILLSICCQISLTNSVPILDPSQIELLIDPLHQAELAGLESKKVVAKSVFNTPIRTPAPHVNRCPPGHHTPQPGGPCVQNLVFVQNDPELIAELTKKFFRDRSSTKKKTNAHRHRTTTLRTPTETVPTTTEAEWMVLSGDSGMFPTEFTTPRTIMSTASVTGRPTKLSESGVDSIVNPMGSASIPDPDHSLPPTPQQQQQQQQQPSFHHQQQQHYTDTIDMTRAGTVVPTVHEIPESSGNENSQNQNMDEGTTTTRETTMDPTAIVFEEQFIPITIPVATIPITIPVATMTMTNNDKENDTKVISWGETSPTDFRPASPEPESESEEPEDTMPIIFPRNRKYPRTVPPEILIRESELEPELEPLPQPQRSIIAFNGDEDDDGSGIFSSSNTNDTDTDTGTTDYGDGQGTGTESEEFDPLPMETVPMSTTPMSEVSGAVINMDRTKSQDVAAADDMPVKLLLLSSPLQPDKNGEIALNFSSTAEDKYQDQNDTMALSNSTKVQLGNDNYLRTIDQISDVVELNTTGNNETKAKVQNTNGYDTHTNTTTVATNDKQELPVETMLNSHSSSELGHKNENTTEQKQVPDLNQTMASLSSSPSENEKNSEARSTGNIFVKVEEITTIMSPLPIPMDELEEVDEFRTTTTVYMRQSPETLSLVTGSKLIDEQKLQLSHSEPIAESFRLRSKSPPEPELDYVKRNEEFIPSPSDIYKATMPPTTFYESHHQSHPNAGLPFNSNDQNPNVRVLFSNMRRMEESTQNIQHAPHHGHEYHQTRPSSTSFMFLHV